MMDAAEADYLEAKNLNAENADVFFNLGNVYLYKAGQL